MSTLLQHTKAELRAAGMFDADAEFNGDVAPHVVSLMETFVAYGHSGGSAHVTLAIFNRLANHLPLTPLTGEDDEWKNPEGAGPALMQINKRCTRVFKDEEMAWDVKHGRKPISFPYTPD